MSLAAALTSAACGAPERPPLGEVAEASWEGDPFVDVTEESGVDFTYRNGMTGDRLLPEVMGGGGALLDADNDGDLDLFLVQGGRLEPDGGFAGLPDRLFRNDSVPGPDGGRRLRFTDVTAESGLGAAKAGYGMGAAAGDFDDDGWTDLYVTALGPNRLLRNRGDGTFEDVTAAAGAGDDRWSVAATFFDADGDGRLDLFVGNYVDFSRCRARPCFGPAGALDYCGPLSYPPLPGRLLRNRGDGTFEDVTAAAGLGAAGSALGALAADLDGDGRVDLYVANDQRPNHLWINLGGGRFEDRALVAGTAVNAEGAAEASMGIAAADVEGDGDLDLLLSHLRSETHTLYLNQGRGLFRDASWDSGLGGPSWWATGFGAGFADVDNDGRPDLLVVNGAVRVLEELAAAADPFPLHQRNQLFRNLGGGRFAEVDAGAAFAPSEVSRGALFGDLDDDGDRDAVVVNSEGPARVLVNRLGERNPWIGLRLLGGAGPSDQIGARATVYRKNGPPLVRWVRVDGSYASAGDPRLLFGLGGGAAETDAAVDRVEVRWPDGRRTVWRELAVGRYHTLVDGASPSSTSPPSGPSAP